MPEIVHRTTLLDAADMSVANPPGNFVKVRVYENVLVEFVVEVPAGLVGEALEAAIEEARVQAGPEVERTESVKSTDWDLE